MSFSFFSFSTGYHAPHRNRIQRSLKRLHTVHQSRLVKSLISVDFLAVTVDFWSDRKKISFLCLTGHYVDCDFNLSSTILYFGSYHKRHFAENISNEMEQRLRYLNIYEKVVTITCDGASNMRSAFALFDPSIRVLWCFAHRIHLVICNGLGLWKKGGGRIRTGIGPRVNF
jgi:hypothetical protein